MDKREAIIKEIVENRDIKARCGFRGHPLPGHYYITGMQMSNLRGEAGWMIYVGYCVQVRKKAGEFGTDLVLLRCPDGSLHSHTNQDFYEVTGEQLELLKSVFDEGVTPEAMEDYTQEYTLAGGTFPEVGAVVEPKERQCADGGPRMSVTTTHADGSTSIKVI